MNEKDADFERLSELMHLPAGDPDRREFEERVGKMDAIDRETWLGMMRENDLFRAELMSVVVPVGLDGRLLRIAQEREKPAQWWRAQWLGPIGWKQAAALLMVIGVLTYLWWPSGEPEVERPKPLDSALAMKISNWAVQNQAQTNLDVRSNDPKVVAAALQSKNLPFQVSMLEPDTKVDLRGGGVCMFGSVPAAYSQWKAGDNTYTVYQFDGTPLGVPADFMDTEKSPDRDPHSKMTYHVKIWPSSSGKCTWALVVNSDGATDVFNEAYQ